VTAPLCAAEKPFISAPTPPPSAAATGGLRRPSGHLATVGSNTANILPPYDASSRSPLLPLAVSCALPSSVGWYTATLNAMSQHTYIAFSFPILPSGRLVRYFFRFLVQIKIDGRDFKKKIDGRNSERQNFRGKKGGSQLYTTVVAWLVLGNLDVKCNHKRFMTDMARHKNRC
jgi:hypothetical protein